MRRTSPVDATFVVRVSLDRRGRLTGTVERVKTGEKHRFDGPEGLGGMISRMAARRADEAAEAPGAAQREPAKGDRTSPGEARLKMP